MNYYKSPELAQQYGVSRRTITNWIEQTRQGRLNLELLRVGTLDYIAKTPKNQVIMKGLVEDRRKFLNKRSLKTVTPKAEFYEIFNERQMLDIISNIDTYREIPLQYSYFDGGAELWDQYAIHLYNDEAPNLLTRTIELLESNSSYIEAALRDYGQINIVDVGPGNALPVKKLLSRLLEANKLKKYIAIDISSEMLDIAERNIKEWFGARIVFEGHARDISRDRIEDVVAEPPTPGKKSSVNLVLLFGGTLSNLREPENGWRIVRESMGRNDLLIYALKLDSPTTREQFDFKTSEKSNHLFPPESKLFLDLIGIDSASYEAEMGFNPQEPARFARVRLKHALTIEFEHSRGTWPVALKKDDTLVVWRAKHDSAFDVTNQLYAAGFNPLLASQTQDHDYILVLADLRKDGR